MNDERAFKLDFFLALAAVLLSVITTVALIYQTSVMRDQYAATVWPYLSVDSEYGPDGVKLSLNNDGFGPALVKSAAMTVDGKAVGNWDDYLVRVLKDPLIPKNIPHHNDIRLVTTSIDGATIVRPSQSLQILLFQVPGSHAAVIRHTVDLDFCYCSLNGNCWKLHATPARALANTPQPVRECMIGAKIDSPTRVFRLPH